MTERERLLEAVVEAARETVREIGGTDGLFEALRELRHFDAHQPQPAAGETVTLAVWRHVSGMTDLVEPGSRDEFLHGDKWTRLGTTTLRLDTEVRT